MLHGAIKTAMAAVSALFLVPAAGVPLAHGEMLAPTELSNLIASGAEGTTIVFEGGAQRAFFSTRLKNVARQSPGLGADFIKKSMGFDTLTEGVFVASIEKDGKVQLISGLAGIARDKEKGDGALILVQTFATDKSLREFEKRMDRLFTVVLVEDSGSRLLCHRFDWIKMNQANKVPPPRSVPCEFVVGNVVAASSPK